MALGPRRAGFGAQRTLEASRCLRPLRRSAMPGSPAKTVARKAEAAGGRSGLGPRTHVEAPLWFEALRPRLEGPALNGPPRPRPCAWRWWCSGNPSPASGLGAARPMPWGRAGFGPRGAAAERRTTVASRRVFEGQALNGPTASALCRDARTPRTAGTHQGTALQSGASAVTPSETGPCAHAVEAAATRRGPSLTGKRWRRRHGSSLPSGST